MATPIEQVRHARDMTIEDGLTFEEWMHWVDVVMRASYEITHRDIGDHLWRDMYEDGLSVKDAIFEALDDEGMLF